ncbi:MAG TPA: hypothetical protein DHV57_15745 [Hyphomonas sp.]|uniref:DUF4440 domain-containing protein n=1 Tax=uncultured Hyphomonas sp. TaxID=225298 RepID=UPI000C3B18BB|nr:hypothetical protein [Hyphomonas sp.]MAN91696.1 hypothetical protein [Hyphomonadaceae bacterium]HBL93718.1 hypothetical protein [Hyphomonas sp.]HCJ18862.1 hypothetical protein [Hyphomonas sp.]|tara:strand:+ start:33028 stop:34065 length:1038 start_codon:yes stop_codon:yes gene_type:complete
MSGLIEPNLHPILVHFAYALSLTAVACYVLAAFSPVTGWRDTLRPAADWMLALGAIAIVLTIAAGFQAYYTVAHDTPSHAAMTTHRNWAVPSGIAILLLAVWRWTGRAKAAPGVFIAALIAASLALTVTAWWGGKIVYGYGLGVKSLPQVTGDGHDHDHGGSVATDGHVMDAMLEMVPEAGDHDSSDGHHDPVPTGHDNSDGHHSSVIGPVIASPPSGSAASVAEAFGEALRAGDAAAVGALFAPDAVIAEGGGAERSFEEYSGHHMPADMAYMAAVAFDLKDRTVIESGDMATVISQSEISGTFKGEPVHRQSMETMVLKRDNGAWKITHIHWSSAPITDTHEH